MTDLARRVDDLLPTVLADLTRLVAIESVSADPDAASRVLASAEQVRDLLTEVGCPEVEIVSAGGQPAVIAHFPAPEGKPTVCLYAHHDVQPTGDVDAWSSPPFEATQRGDRLFGRGTADDKGGLAVHLAALRAFDGHPPVGVKLFIEGEEEIGSPTMINTLDAYGERLAADVYVVTDSTNWEVGTPSFTTSLRGLADCVVELATVDHALHSGSFGGVVPDALTSLCRLIATLHDEAGNVAVDGLATSAASPLDYPEQRLRDETGLLDGVSWIGDGPAADRLWAKPAISVIALDATSVEKASNTLAATARAKISLRVAPGQSGADALEKLIKHLESKAPWGARVTVTPGDSGDPSTLELSGPYADAATAAFTEAFGTAPVHLGQGGSIPMVAELARRFPDATMLVTAVGDPDTRAHGIDESMHLGDFAKACLAETLLLERLAAGTGAQQGGPVADS
ncbi:dipeptidase [Propionibacteriaceae bacterium Y1700]|uniref:dipeptidase n=1 Tax=Microlunatus sp. Y1700 TaxID=3418487 RepID=UPI003DA70AC9